MLTKEDAKKLAEKTLSFSKFPECDISVKSSDDVFIRFALNGITTSGKTLVESMSITSTREGRSGTATVSEFDESSLRAAVQRTEMLAAISPQNAEQVPPLPPQKYAEFENFPESALRPPNRSMIAHVRSIVEGAKAKDLVAAGFIQRSAAANAILNKQGNFGYARTANAGLSVTVRTATGSSSGWASQTAVGMEDIDGVAAGRTATDKCLRWRNPKRLEPGRYTVVLEPAAVAGLLGFLRFRMQARAAEEGRSFLSKPGGGTLLGEKVFPAFIHLRTDPANSLLSTVPWSAPFGFVGAFGTGGGEWVPAERTAWFDKGVVTNLVYDRYWAGKSNRQATTAPRDLVLEGSDKSIADLIASVDRGVLVARFWYVRVVNPQTVQLTGLTRDGLFLIEEGKITQPVVNLRFNESPIRVLQNTVAVGKTAPVFDTLGLETMIVPSLVAKDFLFTSVSDAV